MRYILRIESQIRTPDAPPACMLSIALRLRFELLLQHSQLRPVLVEPNIRTAHAALPVECLAAVQDTVIVNHFA